MQMKYPIEIIPDGFGILANTFGYKIPNQVLKIQAGFYIGTQDGEGPVTRESEEYYNTEKEAYFALRDKTFTQRYTA